MIDLLAHSLFGRERVDGVVTEQRVRFVYVRFVETDDRPGWIGWFVMEIGHPFHVIDELGVVFG